jgi:hypothetical protein
MKQHRNAEARFILRPCLHGVDEPHRILRATPARTDAARLRGAMGRPAPVRWPGDLAEPRRIGGAGLGGEKVRSSMICALVAQSAMIWPTFSSSVMRESKSRTRRSTGAEASL